MQSTPSEDPSQLTSYHVRQARTGDRTSLEWVIRKFSPILLANAQYRLRGPLRSVYDAEDVVQDVWTVVVPKLEKLVPQENRYTPVFMKFLSTTLIHLVNNLVRKHISRNPVRKRISTSPDGEDPIAELAADVTGAVTRLLRREAKEAVHDSLQELTERDREIIILRGIEQHPYREIEVLLKEDVKILAVRYQRALLKLRERLPGAIFDEFSEE